MNDAINNKFETLLTPPVITRVAQAMLAKLGTLVKGKSGTVNLVRV